MSTALGPYHSTEELLVEVAKCFRCGTQTYDNVSAWAHHHVAQTGHFVMISVSTSVADDNWLNRVSPERRREIEELCKSPAEGRRLARQLLKESQVGADPTSVPLIPDLQLRGDERYSPIEILLSQIGECHECIMGGGFGHSGEVHKLAREWAHKHVKQTGHSTRVHFRSAVADGAMTRQLTVEQRAVLDVIRNTDRQLNAAEKLALGQIGPELITAH